MTDRVLVGYASAEDTNVALRWAIDLTNATGGELTVVHATKLPITVRNGPPAAIAHQLGSPTWATVDATVRGLGAAASTTTIVDTGSAADVLARYAEAADVVVLGPRRARWFGPDTQRRLEDMVSIPVLRISDATSEIAGDVVRRIDLTSNSNELVSG